MPYKEKQFYIFLAVGVLNTIFGYGVFAGLIYINLHYTIAAFLATCAGVLFNFKTIGNLVFKVNNNGLIGKFITVYIVLYLINILMLKILISMGISVYISGAVMILPLASILTRIGPLFFFISLGGELEGLDTSRPFSLTKEVVTIKKISIMEVLIGPK